MEKLHWTIEEVISYIEELILDGKVNDRELEMYESWKWNNEEFDKDTYFYTYKRILRRMKRDYER